MYFTCICLAQRLVLQMGSRICESLGMKISAKPWKNNTNIYISSLFCLPLLFSKRYNSCVKHAVARCFFAHSGAQPWLTTSDVNCNEVIELIGAHLHGLRHRLLLWWGGRGSGDGEGCDELPLRSCFLKTVLIRGRTWPLTGTAREKHVAHKSRGCNWDKGEKCNQEVLEGRQLQRASGWLIIALIRERHHPNNIQANCFKSALARVPGLQDTRLPHEPQMQMKYYKCYFLGLFFKKTEIAS